MQLVAFEEEKSEREPTRASGSLSLGGCWAGGVLGRWNRVHWPSGPVSEPVFADPRVILVNECECAEDLGGNSIYNLTIFDLLLKLKEIFLLNLFAPFVLISFWDLIISIIKPPPLALSRPLSIHCGGPL